MAKLFSFLKDRFQKGYRMQGVEIDKTVKHSMRSLTDAEFAELADFDKKSIFKRHTVYNVDEIFFDMKH